MPRIDRDFLTIVMLAALAAPEVPAAFQPAPAVEQDARHGTSAGDYASDLGVDAAGNVYQLIGTDGTFPGETSAGSRDVAVAKFAADGTHVWTTQLGTSGFDADGGEIAVTSAGVVGVAGYTSGAFPGFTHLGGFYDAFFAILDADGNVTFTDQFGTSEWDEAAGVDTDGTSFFVTGFTDGTLAGQTSAGGRDGFVRRYDASGNVTGEIQFGTAGSDTAGAVAAAPDGSVFVTGFTTGAFSTAVGMNDGFVVKLDASLGFVAGANHGTTANDNYRGIDVGAGGHVVVAGSTFGAIPGEIAQGWDIVVQGIDPADLSSSWIRQFGVTGNTDNGWDVTVAADGTSYTACTTYGLEDLGAVGNEHGCVVALDALGSDLWNDQFIAVGATLGVKGSALDPDGGVWLAGETAGTFGGSPIGGTDAIRRKYAPFAGSVVEITACGFVADAPGDYRVANDVAGGGVCIDVTSAGVVLDLNGFRVTSTDGVADVPGAGIRVAPGLDARVVNHGSSSAEILVDGAGGIGLDLSTTIAATIDGGAHRIHVELTAAGDGKVGLDLSGSTAAVIRGVDGHDASPDGTGVRIDDSVGLDYRDGHWAHEQSLALQRALAGANVADLVAHDLSSDGGALEIQGTGLDIARYRISPGISLNGSLFDVEGDGEVVDFVAGADLGWGGGGFRGSSTDPARTLNLTTPTFEGFRGDVSFGDNVRVQDGVFLAGGLDGRISVRSITIPAVLTGALFRATDPAHPIAIDVAQGASATIDDNLTMGTYTADGQSLVGSVGMFGTNMTLSSGLRYAPFVDAHTAEVDNDLVSLADSLDFFLAGLAPGDKTTFVDGTVELACASEPDGLSVTCPPRVGTYTFGHEVNDVGCGAVYATPGIVVLQEGDLTATAGTTCIELAADVVYDMNDRSIVLPAGSPGVETRAVAITGAGATVQDGTVRMTGTDTVGSDVSANDATLLRLRFEYDGVGARGVRAQSIENFTVIDDSHIGTGLPGDRIAFACDSVGNLYAVRSQGGDDLYAYDFQWNIENSDGTIVDANWTGGISASGAGVDATLVFERTRVDARGAGRAIDFGDDVVYRDGRLYVNDASPVGNRAVSRGPRFERAELFTYDERGVPLIEDNPGAPSVVAGSLTIATERDGIAHGRTRFPATIPDTDESGVANRYAYDDRDSARLGDDLPAEPTVKLTFESMVTPSDTAGAGLRLEAAGQDAIANGGCAVTSVAPDPVELTCDRDLGTGAVGEEVAHYVYCGDGVRNEQVAGDACDPPGSGKCQAGCTLPPPPDLVDLRVEVGATDPDEVVLTWADTGEGPYEIYRSTDPATVATVPGNRIGLTSGTSWTDVPPAGGPFHYRVVPAP